MRPLAGKGESKKPKRQYHATFSRKGYLPIGVVIHSILCRLKGKGKGERGKGKGERGKGKGERGKGKGERGKGKGELERALANATGAQSTDLLLRENDQC